MQHDGSDYLGKMIDEERRLVLVPLDPARPWAAFRRMRAWMKRARPSAAHAPAEIFQSPPEMVEVPAEDVAEVIPLRRRDAGR